MTLFSAGHFDGGASGPLYRQLQRHIAAALAAWPVLAALLAQPLRQNAAGSGAARA